MRMGRGRTDPTGVGAVVPKLYSAASTIAVAAVVAVAVVMVIGHAPQGAL